ncbi:MAG TPA: 4-hydroxy-tetrahydrodipicolinate synthase [Bacillota bacterium]|mgnify:FL=1|nr:4-hydroxy-tetrahydrodipicolinate synthase [Bacillota bacterium]HQD06908.1 4-hydroxy-tetrahydrodipicolinate synthase [Bacillota bacterium]
MTGNFGAVVTAMVTPFDERGEVNYEAAAELAAYLVKNGSTGLVLSGTTGESPTLSMEEKLELFRVVVEAVGEKAYILAGTGSYSTRDAVKLTKAASETGVHGILSVTPYYNRPPQEGLFRHFREVAGATDLPVMIYNVPKRTGVNISPETTLRLAEIENIVSIKEAGQDLEQAAAICRNAPPGFTVYSGDDSLTLPMLSVGAVGVVSVASNIAGPAIARMIADYQNNRTEEAAALHRKLLPLFQGLFMTSSPIPVKAALKMMGFPVGEPRLPLVPLEAEQEARLQQLLREYGLI